MKNLLLYFKNVCSAQLLRTKSGWFLMMMTLQLTLVAQISLEKDALPKAGDSLFTKVDNLPNNVNLLTPGANRTWNFAQLNAPFTRSTVLSPAREGQVFEWFPRADFVKKDDQKREWYYQNTPEGLLNLGCNGLDLLNIGVISEQQFNPPLVEKHAPLEYGESYISKSKIELQFSVGELPKDFVRTLPLRPDSVRIHYNIVRKDEIDAWGLLTIPDNTYDVLRQKRTETIDIRLEAKMKFFNWQDVTKLLPAKRDLGKRTRVSYHFYSNETAQTIARVDLKKNSQQIEKIEFIAENREEKRKLANSSPGLYVSPNPAIETARFEFVNLPAGNYTLKIYNLLGVEIWKNEYFIKNSHTEKLDITDFRKGTYLYSLVNERGKTLMTKRLMVIRP